MKPNVNVVSRLMPAVKIGFKANFIITAGIKLHIIIKYFSVSGICAVSFSIFGGRYGTDTLKYAIKL